MTIFGGKITLALLNIVLHFILSEPFTLGHNIRASIRVVDPDEYWLHL